MRAKMSEPKSYGRRPERQKWRKTEAPKMEIPGNRRSKDFEVIQ